MEDDPVTKHPYDGSSIDLERALVRHMAERQISRRYLLERIALLGGAAALAPVIAACTGSNSATPSAAANASGGTRPRTSAPTSSRRASTGASTGPTPEPTAPPTPEGELFIYNWAQYMGKSVIPSFEKKYGVKVTTDFFDNYDTMLAKIGQGGGGYDITFPTSTDVPGLLTRGLIQALDPSLLTNIGNLGAEWQNPGYDPGNAHSIPYMWWTTGVAYDTAKVSEKLEQLERAVGREVQAAHRGPRRHARGVRGGAVPATARTRTPPTMPTSTRPSSCSRSRSRWSGSTPPTTSASSRRATRGWPHAWGSDLYQVVTERPTVKFYIPDEGGIRGSDTAVLLANAKHPIAAQLFMNHLLDAKVSAKNTNYIGYMGPNAAAKEFIKPYILKDPAVNPDQSVVDSLVELLDLGADLDKYATRWTTLRSGA